MKDSFKHKLKQHRPEWDKEAFWADLESDLPKKPRKRRFLWWIWISLAGLTISGAAMWYIYQLNQHTSEPSITEQLRIVTGPENILPTPTDTSAQQIQGSIYKGETNTKNNPVNAVEMQRTDQKSGHSIPEPSYFKTVRDTQAVHSVITDDSSSFSTKKAIEETSDHPMALMNQIPTLLTSIAFNEQPIIPRGEVQLTPSPDEKSSGKWYQRFSLGIAKPVRHFRNAYPELINKKKREEGLREVITANYLAGYSHHSGIYIQAGLQIQQRRELLQWSGIEDSSSVERMIDRAYFIYDQNGQTTYGSGDRPVIQIRRRSIIQQNYYRLVNLPIQMGYEYGYKRWSGFVEAGLDINLLHTFSGKFIDINNQVKEQQVANPQIIQRQLGIGWSTGFGVTYKLLPETDIFLKVNHQQFRRSIHQNQTYDQWNTNWGLAVGVRKGFL
jgi:hypothetical protein